MLYFYRVFRRPDQVSGRTSSIVPLPWKNSGRQVQIYFNQYQSSGMKYLVLVLIIPFLSASECRKHKKKEVALPENTKPVSDSVPFCVRQLINEGNKETPPNAPLQVDEYLYNNKKVFLFTAPCCDQFDMLYDDSCKAICAPSGGFSGRGDGKCPDFSKTARYIKIVWKSAAK